MKKSWVAVLVVSAMVMVPLVALAQVSGPPANDAWVELANPDSPSNDTSTELQNLWARSALAACNPDRASYLKWDLTNVTPGTIFQSVDVNLRANFVSGDWTGAQISLREAGDSWSDTVTWNTQPNNPPTTGAELGKLAVAGAGTITFSSDTFPLLRTYVQQEADGDNVVSFVLVVVGNCGIQNAAVRFDSKEPAAGGVAPALLLTSEPNSVTLTDSSAQQTNSLPLYVGLGALALVAAIGVGVSRRRTAAR